MDPQWQVQDSVENTFLHDPIERCDAEPGDRPRDGSKHRDMADPRAERTHPPRDQPTISGSSQLSAHRRIASNLTGTTNAPAEWAVVGAVVLALSLAFTWWSLATSIDDNQHLTD